MPTKEEVWREKWPRKIAEWLTGEWPLGGGHAGEPLSEGNWPLKRRATI